MLMFILLAFILFLLVLLFVMQVTGWSVTSRQEPPEQFIREFRREMAGQRDETIRNLQAIKSEIESLFSDGIDEKIDPLIKPKFLDVKSYNLLIFDKLQGFYAICTHVNHVKRLALFGFL